MIFFCVFDRESPWITLIRSLLSELRKTRNFLCIKKHYTIVLKSRPRNAPYELIFRAESKNIRLQFLIILLTVKLLCILNNVWKIWNRCLRTIFFSRKTETVSHNIYFVDNLCEDHNLWCSERPSNSVRVKILIFLQDENFRWTYFIKIHLIGFFEGLVAALVEKIRMNEDFQLRSLQNFLSKSSCWPLFRLYTKIMKLLL